MRAARRPAGEEAVDKNAAALMNETTTLRPLRDLRPLFSPSSVAVVGASDDEAKWGNWIAKGALRGAHRREVFLVNRRATTVLGRSCYPAVTALPSPPELVVLSVPASGFAAAVDDALAAGAKAIVAITAGLAETGVLGEEVERRAAAAVRRAGAVLLGPNCLGMSDVSSELYLSSDDLPPGSIGLISQSGNLALELGVKARQAALGFSRFVSIGNQADLEVADLVAEFAEADDVEAIALYCEDFKDGLRFLEAAAAAVHSGTPVVLLTLGSSAAASRAARSHTGALVSGARAIDAACRAAGIERVTTPKELLDTMQAVLAHKLPAGDRIGIVADGGGHGAVAAEAVERLGLAVPAFSPELSLRLAAATGTTGGTSNPVDLAGAGEQDMWSFERVVATALGSEEIDAVLMTGYFGAYSQYGGALAATERDVAEALTRLGSSSEKPLVVHAMHHADPSSSLDPTPLARLREERIPVVANVEDAAFVLSRLVERSRLDGPRLPDRPPAAPEPARPGYFPTRTLLCRSGIAVPKACEVHSSEEAVAAAREVGYPVAVKAVGLLHKSDAGGVVLDVESEDELRAAVTALLARLGPQVLSVEEMAGGAGVELLVGSVRDPRFGPVVVVGAGGVHAEVLDDVATALAPVGAYEAERLIGSLRVAPLLEGARGRRPLDVSAAASAVAALSQVAAAHPEISEIEVNPLLVRESGAIALDARMLVPPGERARG